MRVDEVNGDLETLVLDAELLEALLRHRTQQEGSRHQGLNSTQALA